MKFDLFILSNYPIIDSNRLNVDNSAPMEHNIHMDKMITIVEIPPFQSQVGVCIKLDERDELIDFLARNPNTGDEIPSTGGIRKLRWGGKGKGKRGGLRVIYYFYNESAPVFLLTVFGKGVQEDLTLQQNAKLTNLAKLLKQECKKVRKPI